MQILPTSASIFLNRTAATPAAKAASGSMFFHLTKGFDTNPNIMKDAISFEGNLEAITNKKEFEDFRFGFIQLMQLVEYQVVYLGRTPGDGQVTIQVSTNLLLDSKPSIQPFTSIDTSQLIDVPFQQAKRITTNFGDHPSSKVGLGTTNLRTRANMFLFRFLDNRLAVTALVAQDPQGKRQILAHLTWILRYEFEVVWRKSSPVVSGNRSNLAASSSKLGPPTGAASSQITQGAPPNYNAEVQARIFKVVANVAPGRKDEDFPSAKGRPPDFFQP